jgi:hypothetical protein
MRQNQNRVISQFFNMFFEIIGSTCFFRIFWEMIIDSATFPVLDRVRVDAIAGGTLESLEQTGATVEQC